MKQDPGVRFSEFESRDLPAALAVFNHYVRTSTAVYMDAPLSEEEFSPLVNFPDPRHGTFSIFREGRFAGYVTLKPFSPRSGYSFTAEISVFLDPALVGKGTGSAAIGFIEQKARERGFHVLLACVSGDNEASLRLFERTGYGKVGHFRDVGFKFGRRLDTIYCEKILGATPRES